MLYNYSSLTLSNFNTNNVTNLASIFYNCSSLISFHLSNFNTNNVTDMEGMFYRINEGYNLICNEDKILNKFS